MNLPKVSTVLSMFGIKSNTPDSILKAMEIPEVLRKFLTAKEIANAADAERDRLRKFIQENVPTGRHGEFVVTHEFGKEQCYPNAEGKWLLQHGIILDPRTNEKVDNKNLYELKGPHKVGITEVPES